MTVYRNWGAKIKKPITVAASALVPIGAAAAYYFWPYTQHILRMGGPDTHNGVYASTVGVAIVVLALEALPWMLYRSSIGHSTSK